MDSEPLSYNNLFLTLFLVILNGFFVAAEFAIVKVRSSQLETIKEGFVSRNFEMAVIKCDLWAFFRKDLD